MRGITARAAEKLRRMLGDSGGTAPKGVRLSDLDGRLGLAIDSQAPGLSDKVFKYEGQDLLVVGFAAASRHAASILDFENGQFRIV